MINRATPKKSGFTLIEIIIVIVIVGVLSTLALPRFFETIEFARSLEAMNMMASIKRAAGRCSIMGGTGSSDYTSCITWPALAMGPPGLIPGTHFCYSDPTLVVDVWSVQAERNNFNSTGTGAPCDPSTGAGTGVGDTITLGVNVTSGLVTRVGSGAFSGIR